MGDVNRKVWERCIRLVVCGSGSGGLKSLNIQYMPNFINIFFLVFLGKRQDFGLLDDPVWIHADLVLFDLFKMLMLSFYALLAL